MPFEIVRGSVDPHTRKNVTTDFEIPEHSDGVINKKLKRKNLFANLDSKKNIHTAYLSENGMMDDVINLKVYKIVNKTDASDSRNEAEKVLIGEQIINSVVSSPVNFSKRSRPVKEKEKEPVVKEDAKINSDKNEYRSLLHYHHFLAKQKLRMFVMENDIHKDEGFVDHIKSSNMRATNFRAGQEMTSELNERTLEETLEWAVSLRIILLSSLYLFKLLNFFLDKLRKAQ